MLVIPCFNGTSETQKVMMVRLSRLFRYERRGNYYHHPHETTGLNIWIRRAKERVLKIMEFFMYIWGEGGQLHSLHFYVFLETGTVGKIKSFFNPLPKS